MISILFTLLKIIGMVLLLILGVFLCLLLIVLFVPIRYRVKGKYEDSLYLKGRITWLFHLLSVRVEVGEETVTSVRILGIPLSIFKRKKMQNEIPFEPAVKDKTDEFTAKEGKSEDVSVYGEVVDDMPVPKPLQESVITEKRSLYRMIKNKISGLIDKIKGFIQRIRDFFCDIGNKKKQLQRYIKILRSDTVKEALSLCKNRFGRMLRSIFPRKIRAELTFGFEDPATTGYALAVYGMLPAYVGKHILLHPDFDRSVLSGNFRLKGKIRACTLLYHMLAVFLDKNCRKLYHIVKKEIKNEHE